MANDFTPDAQIDENWSPRPVKRALPWRARAANVLSLMALGCLCTGPVAVAFLYAYAWRQGLYPNPAAPPVLHRGGWSYNKELGRGVMLLFDICFYPSFFSVLSLIFKPTLRAGIILGACFLFTILAIAMIGLVED